MIFADIISSQVYFSNYSLFFLVYKCSSHSKRMPDETVAVHGGGAVQRDGPSHPRSWPSYHHCSLSSVFSLPFNPSYLTIMDRVQAFGKTFR
jgi:hypothetical protein